MTEKEDALLTEEEMLLIERFIKELEEERLQKIERNKDVKH